MNVRPRTTSQMNKETDTQGLSSRPMGEGVRVVPVEPTEEMRIAGQMAIPALPYYAEHKQRTGDQEQPWAYAVACYKAMLSAAPAHPSQQREGLAKKLIEQAAYLDTTANLLREAAAALTPPAPQEGINWPWFVERVVLRVAEIPDRTSPDDQPEMMLVTPQELRGIVEDELNAALNARDHLTSPHHTANRDQGAVE